MTDVSQTLFSRRGMLRLSGLGVVATLAACSTTDVLKTDAGSGSDQTAAALPLVNAVRAKQNLPPLVFDKVAATAALDQARRMAKAGKMAHLIGFNDDFAARMKQHDVVLPAAENIAAGQDETSRAVTAWINSPKHLHNMLGNYRGLGVAVVRNPASGNRPYWAMVLSS